jgi:hypothetical protein
MEPLDIQRTPAERAHDIVQAAITAASLAQVTITRQIAAKGSTRGERAAAHIDQALDALRAALDDLGPVTAGGGERVVNDRDYPFEAPLRASLIKHRDVYEALGAGDDEGVRCESCGILCAQRLCVACSDPDGLP